MERVLESEGYPTTTAWTGQEALSLLEKTEFDVILIDEHLPEIEFQGFLGALTHKQPNAVRVMPSARKIEAAVRHGLSPSVCKWNIVR